MPGWVGVIIITAVLLFLYQFSEMIRKGWPENKKEKVTFLLVTKNKEKVIEGIIRGLMNIRKKGYPEYEVVIVDKGSRDDTLPILYKLSKEYSDLTIVTSYYRFTKDSLLSIVKEKCQGEIVYYFNLIDEIKPLTVVKEFNNLLQGKSQQDNVLLRKMNFFLITKKIYAESKC